jgi:adenylylsulfate kinase
MVDSMKILIMGLPNSGKTYLAERLQTHLDCAWLNADEVRRMANDWDFSEEARIRQARRMRNLADYEKSEGSTVICDFVCPTELTRYIFEADYTIWMNTIAGSVYEDTNSLFEPPSYADLVIEKFLTNQEIASVVNKIAGVYE